MPKARLHHLDELTTQKRFLLDELTSVDRLALINMLADLRAVAEFHAGSGDDKIDYIGGFNALAIDRLMAVLGAPSEMRIFESMDPVVQGRRS